MQLTISNNANLNYLAKLVYIKEFYPHPNEQYTRIKLAKIDGYQVIVGIDEKPGWYIYFPTLCTINPTLLSYLNLYEDRNINSNPEAKPGFFAKNGRVKALKLGGALSEGFLLPFEALQSYLISNVNTKLEDPTEELEFNQVSHKGKDIWICKKYVVMPQQHPYDRRRNKRDNKLKKFDKVIEGQFHFHYDTLLLKKDITVINPEDYIHISEKIHGSSGISAYVICRKKPTFKDKIIEWFTKQEATQYDYIFASRTVIKDDSEDSGYYDSNIWKYAHEVVKPYLTPGLTLYYEIVGFTPKGKYIQKNYDYGCVQPDGSYKSEVNFKVRIYRITLTDPNNNVFEFSPLQVQRWCKRNNLIPVTQYYYGKAKDLYPDIDNAQHWHENFLEKLSNDFYLEKDSPSCNNKVPHEGIVIKKDNGYPNAFKLKSFAFLNKEQKAADAGETNIEDNQ